MPRRENGEGTIGRVDLDLAFTPKPPVTPEQCDARASQPLDLGFVVPIFCEPSTARKDGCGIQLSSDCLAGAIHTARGFQGGGTAQERFARHAGRVGALAAYEPGFDNCRCETALDRAIRNIFACGPGPNYDNVEGGFRHARS
jgi:hypothetical protein